MGTEIGRNKKKMDDLLLPAYQKLYAAMQSLERFSKGHDLFENIACIDSFLSEFRNVTFVLQKSLAHTEFEATYNTLIDKYLKNDDCKWLKDKRNEVLKQKPFSLEKSLTITLYLPNEAGAFPTESYTIDDEEDYSSLIEMVKRIIEKIPSIEVFFSVEFIYKEIGSDRNLFSTIDNGIDSILALLVDIDNVIACEKSNAREQVLEKIEKLRFHKAPKEFWFIDDYVFYRKDNIFEKGERFEVITPFKTAVPYTILCDLLKVEKRGNFIEETFEAFERMHIIAFANQKELAPTLLTLREDGILSMAMYNASIKTTTYRKINEIAKEIESGAPIVAVFHVCEMLCYNNPDAFEQDYSYRSKGEHSELLSFSIVTKDGCSSYYISSEAIMEEKKDCMFPILTKVETDDTISYMNPLVKALQKGC